MLAAALGVAVCGAAHGQSLEFFARERGGAVARDDKAVAVAYWYDDQPGTANDRGWMFTAGYVTQNDAEGYPHTRLAVFKYPADVNNTATATDPPGPSYGQAEAFAYYPPGGSWTPVGQHAATAMAVDELTGDVYVTGYTTLEENGDNGTDANYIIVKYDKDLGDAWTGTGWGSVATARGYDGTASNPDGDDRAVSIAFVPGTFDTNGTVLVTGASAGASTGDDIVTLRYDGDGNPSSHWGTGGEDTGIRRWDGGHGDDTAAEVGWFVIVDEDLAGLQTAIVGTSDQGSTRHLDRVVLCYDPTGAHSGDPGWAKLYDNSGGDDYGTGFAKFQESTETPVLYACGHSEVDAASPPDVDFVVSRINPSNGETGTDPYFTWVYDFGGGADEALDITISASDNVPIRAGWVWITGRVADNGMAKAGLLVLDASGSGNVVGATVYSYAGATTGNAVCAFMGSCMIAGTTLASIGDADVVVLWYHLALGTDPTLVLDGAARFPGNGNANSDEGLAIARGLQTDEAIVGGATTYSSGALTDLSTLRITGP
ncbi:MAG: hypothetical protein IT437_13665 [Phycisphaerales bacterium]|nr:hypothetical protein [Phycisphaerales bacterium]